MIPLEVIIRRVATGSYLKRYPNIKEGTRFEQPIVEFTFKDDSKGDPLITGKIYFNLKSFHIISFHFISFHFIEFVDDEIVANSMHCGSVLVDRNVVNFLKKMATKTFLT